MDVAEQLYAERGFAGVSIRQIGEAAGQRNKSAVQYHFSNRDELIKAIIDRHVTAVGQRRMEMIADLKSKREINLRDRMACLVLPSVLHGINLGVPSWHARFMAQALAEPTLREYAIQSHATQDSMRLLRELAGAPQHASGDAVLLTLATMIRQLAVHMCAELEYDLAHGRVPASGAEPLWRKLGDRLLVAVCGIATAFFSQV